MIATAPPPAAVSAPADHPKTYLLSVVGIPLKPNDRVIGFSFATWGVTFNAVCQIPYGWSIKAGGSATPEGTLEGESSLGTTWLSSRNSPALRHLALITLYEPVQHHDVGVPNASQYVPATFTGHARLWNDDAQRKVKLTWINVRLTPASRCPPSKP